MVSKREGGRDLGLPQRFGSGHLHRLGLDHVLRLAVPVEHHQDDGDRPDDGRDLERAAEEVRPGSCAAGGRR